MCTFPAAKWMRVKRELAELADESKDPRTVRWCCEGVLFIEQKGQTHMDSGCECWREAGAAKEAEVAA